jgi:hypothetical protein
LSKATHTRRAITSFADWMLDRYGLDVPELLTDRPVQPSLFDD